MRELTADEIAAWEARAAEGKKQHAILCARNLETAMRAAIEACGVPERACELLASGKVSDTQARAAIREGSDLLVVSGGTGSGKTVAAVEWLRSWILDPANWADADSGLVPHLCGRAVFTKAAALARWERFDAEKMAVLVKATRLVVDDLGVEYLDKNGCYLSLLDEILDARYDAGRPTVITTNLDANEFKVRYGERIADRIRECGRFVGCGRESMRRKAVAA